jgi:hypothetical protein
MYWAEDTPGLYPGICKERQWSWQWRGVYGFDIDWDTHEHENCHLIVKNALM